VPTAALVETIDLAQRDLAADLAPSRARYPRLAEAMCEALFLPGLDPRLAVSVLLRLAEPAAPDAVRRFAAGRGMGDYDRVFAHVALRGAGFDDPATPASVWLGGRRRELALPALRLKNEEAPAHSEKIKDLMQQAAEAQEQDSSARAAEIYEQVLAIDPNLQEARHNMGTALMLSGRMQEGETHVRHALDLDPGYALARCNLASLELTRGNAAAAHELLDPLETRIDYTVEEVLAYLRTRSDLARADGDLARAESLLHALLAFDHENSLAKERLASLAAQPMLAGR
jgi:tetratricopeptide (TPR) repeat protein